jgi:AbrB family looped-hinge helix DNA binding protein
MSISKITSKGQITLPKDVRDKLHLEIGEKIDFRVDEATQTATLVPLNKRVSDVFGILKNSTSGEIITVKAMKEALSKKFKERDT